MSEGPGGGDVSGEINIRVNVTPGEDVETVARQQGEEFNQAFGEAVASHPIALPRVDGAAFASQVDDIAGQVTERLSRTTEQLGLQMREAMAPPQVAVATDQPFRNLTEAAAAYREELRRVEVQLEELTRGNLFSRTGGGIVDGRATTTFENALRQFQRVSATGQTEMPSAYLLSEEARRAITGGQVAIPNMDDYKASTVAALRRQAAAAPDSDAEQAVARAQAELQRVLIDNVAYSMRDGSWLKLNAAGASRGVVEDPAILAQLRQVQETAVTGAVRAQLDEIAQRDPNFSRYGLAAGTEYGPYGVPSHEVLSDISQTPQTTEGLSALVETLKLFTGETSDLARALDVARGTILRLADESAAYAENTDRAARAEREASEAAATYEAQLRRLTAAFNDQDAAIAARETAAAKAMLAQAQERAEGTYGQNLAYGSYGPNIAATAESERAAAEAARNAELGQAMIARAQAAAYDSYGPNLAAGRWSGGNGGGGVQPPPGVSAPFPEDPEWAAKFAAALRQVQAATETAVPGFEKLAGVIVLTEEQLRNFFATGKLDPRAANDAIQAGTPGVVRTPSGTYIGYNTDSGNKIEKQLSAEQALVRVDSELAASQGQAASSLTKTGEAAKMTREQLDELRAKQGLLQRFWQAAFGGDVGDGGHAGVNAFKRTAGDNAEFLGAITRYQIAYAGIFAISRGLSALVADTTESQVAVIHLSEALGAGTDVAERYASSLNDIADTAGTSVVDAMQAAVRGIYSFNDQAHTPKEREQIGRVSAQAAAMGHVIAGGDAAAVQQELVATTRDFNGSAQDQIRVLDAATNAYHNYGAAIGDILQSLPIVSQQAHQAGLSIEETANYISLIETRTGQSGSAAGTALARILESVQKPAFSQALSGIGVDTSGTQAQQIQELTRKWSGLSQAQQDNFAQLAVGSRGAGAFLAIMQEGNGILGANKRSYEELGSAQTLFIQQQGTLGGMLRRIGADLQAIGLDLARSGVLDFAGLILRGLDPLLHGVDDLLRLFDMLPGSIRPWVTGLAEVLALLVLIGRQQASNNAETAVAGATGALGAGEEAALMSGAEVGAVGAAGAERGVFGRIGAGTVAAGESAGGALSSLGSALLGPVGAVAGLVALGIAAGAAVDALKAEHEARRQATAATQQFNQANTADELHSAASALGNAAVAQEHANSRFFGLFASASDHDRVIQLQQAAVLANNLAAALTAEQVKQAGSSRGGLQEYFTGPTDDAVSALNNGLTNMEQAGVPAVRMLHLLARALDSVGGSAGDAVGPVYGTVAFQRNLINQTQRGLTGFEVNPGEVNRAGLGDLLLGRSGPNIPLRGSFVPSRFPSRAGVGPGGVALSDGDWAASASRAVREIANPQALGTAVSKAMSAIGVGPNTVITPALEKLLADKTIDLLGLDQVINGSARQRLTGAIEKYVGGIPTVGGGVLPKFKGQADFNRFVLGDKNDPSQLDAIDQYAQMFNDPRNANGNVDVLKAQVGVYRHLANEGFGGAAQVRVLSLLHAAQDNYVKVEIANAERLRAAAIAHDGKSVSAQLATNVRFITQEVQVAGRQGDVSAIIGIIGTADAATIRIVREHLRHDYDIAKAAYDADLRLLNDLESLPAGIRNTDPIVQKQIAAAQRVLAKADAAVRASLAPLKAFLQAMSAGATTTPPDTAAADKIDPREIAIARIEAREVPGSALSAASVALQVAQYQKAHAKNQQEYWAAVKAINDAEYQMMQATQDYMHQVRLEHIDVTDPVATTHEDQITARRQLAADLRRGAGRDTIATDRNAITSANNAHQQAVFEQRMHDAQNAHELGEMSDKAYLRFLEGQRDRLQAIKHKTRQQIEELQEVDQAIKSAADQFQGQWNIGSIRIPTPYEARRYVQAAGAAASSVAYSHTTQTVSIRIDDQTSDQKVRRIMREFLSQHQVSRLHANPPKVGR